jgi:hypothetical protein
MDPFLVGGIALGVWVVAGLWAAAKEIYARGLLRGMQDAIKEITVGVASNCERQAIPEQVADQLEGTKEATAKAKGSQDRVYAVSMRLCELGNALGMAAWQAGCEAGQQNANPREGEIRIDLTTQELIDICWLSHYGFKQMIWGKDTSFTFKDEKEAEEATYAIGKLERRFPESHGDLDDPYAQAFHRQCMIWERWPSETAP